MTAWPAGLTHIPLGPLHSSLPSRPDGHTWVKSTSQLDPSEAVQPHATAHPSASLGHSIAVEGEDGVSSLNLMRNPSAAWESAMSRLHLQTQWVWVGPENLRLQQVPWWSCCCRSGSHFGNQGLRHAMLFGRCQSTCSIKRAAQLAQREE